MRFVQQGAPEDRFSFLYFCTDSVRPKLKVNSVSENCHHSSKFRLVWVTCLGALGFFLFFLKVLLSESEMSFEH